MTKTDKKPRNWQRIILVGSLALNLGVIGVFGGLALGGGADNRMHRFDLTAGPLTRAMDEDRRAAVRDDLRASGAFRAEDRANMRRDVSVLIATLRADTFDEDTFRTVLMRQQERMQSGQTAVVEAVAAQVNDMSAQERVTFADSLEQQFRRDGEQRNDRSGG